jgi:hypothetical protein
VIQKSDFAVGQEEAIMLSARTQFTIRCLMGVVAVTAVLMCGVILLLRDSATTRPPSLPRSKGVIMEGVDLNWQPMRERHEQPRTLLPPEIHGGRRF